MPRSGERISIAPSIYAARFVKSTRSMIMKKAIVIAFFLFPVNRYFEKTEMIWPSLPLFIDSSAIIR